MAAPRISTDRRIPSRWTARKTSTPHYMRRSLSALNPTIAAAWRSAAFAGEVGAAAAEVQQSATSERGMDAARYSQPASFLPSLCTAATATSKSAAVDATPLKDATVTDKHTRGARFRQQQDVFFKRTQGRGRQKLLPGRFLRKDNDAAAAGSGYNESGPRRTAVKKTGRKSFVTAHCSSTDAQVDLPASRVVYFSGSREKVSPCAAASNALFASRLQKSARNYAANLPLMRGRAVASNRREIATIRRSKRRCKEQHKAHCRGQWISLYLRNRARTEPGEHSRREEVPHSTGIKRLCHDLKWKNRRAALIDGSTRSIDGKVISVECGDGGTRVPYSRRRQARERIRNKLVCVKPPGVMVNNVYGWQSESEARAKTDFSDIRKVLRQQQRSGTDAHADDGELLPLSLFPCAEIRSPTTREKVVRERMHVTHGEEHKEEVKPRLSTAATYGSAVGRGANFERGWVVRSGIPGEKGKGLAAAAAAAAATVHFEKPAGMLSGRTSRLMRDFTDIEVVGKGGCGRVLRARHLLDGRTYAIKEIKFAATIRHLEARMQLFLREVQCLRRLDSNENIVRYFSSWVEVTQSSKLPTPRPLEEEEAKNLYGRVPGAEGLGSVSAAEEEAATTAHAAGVGRLEEDRCKSSTFYSVTSSGPFGGKDIADECFSFYSLPYSQTSACSDPRDPFPAKRAGATKSGDSSKNIAAPHERSLKPSGGSEAGTTNFLRINQNEGKRVEVEARGQQLQSSCGLVEIRARDSTAERATARARVAPAAARAGIAAAAERRAGQAAAATPEITLHEDCCEPPCAEHCGDSKYCSTSIQKAEAQALNSLFLPAALHIPFSSTSLTVREEAGSSVGKAYACSVSHLRLAKHRGSFRGGEWPSRRTSRSDTAASGKELAGREVSLTSMPNCCVEERSDRRESSRIALQHAVSAQQPECGTRVVFTKGTELHYGPSAEQERASFLPLRENEACPHRKVSNARNQHQGQGGCLKNEPTVSAGSLCQARPDPMRAAAAQTISLPPATSYKERMERHDTGRNVLSLLRPALRRKRSCRYLSAHSVDRISFTGARHAHRGHEKNSKSRPGTFFSPLSPNSLRSPPSFRWDFCSAEQRAGREQTGGCGFTASVKHEFISSEKPASNKKIDFLTSGSCSRSQSSRSAVRRCKHEEDSTAKQVTAAPQDRSHTFIRAEAAFVPPTKISSRIGSAPYLPCDARRCSVHDFALFRGEQKAATHQCDDGVERAVAGGEELEEKRSAATQATGDPQQESRILSVPMSGIEVCAEISTDNGDVNVTEDVMDVTRVENEQERSGCKAGKRYLFPPVEHNKVTTSSASPTFVALDEFLCCDDFGIQTQSTGLEIVFAEEAALPSPRQKESTGRDVDTGGAAAEDGRRNQNPTDMTRVTAARPSVSVYLLNSLVSAAEEKGKRQENVCVSSLATQQQEQQNRQRRANSFRGHCGDCDVSSAPLLEADEKYHLPRNTEVVLLSEKTEPPTHLAPQTMRSTRRGEGEGGKAQLATAEARLGNKPAVSRWSSPVAERAAAPAAAGKSVALEEVMKNQLEREIRVEKNPSVKYHPALLRFQQLWGQQPLSGQERHKQVKQNQWQELEQTEQQQQQRAQQLSHRALPPNQAQQQTELQQQQQHETHASLAAAAAAGLNGTKVNSAGAGRVEVSLYIQMEYCPMSLEEYIARTPEIDPERNEDIMEMIVNGLYRCHTAGIMHRDLKPSNIFIEEGGTVKLGDFGLAYSEDMEEDLWNSASPASARSHRYSVGGGGLTSAPAAPKTPRLLYPDGPPSPPRRRSFVSAASCIAVQGRQSVREGRPPFMPDVFCDKTRQELKPASLKQQEMVQRTSQDTREADSYSQVLASPSFVSPAEIADGAGSEKYVFALQETQNTTSEGVRPELPFASLDSRSIECEMCSQHLVASMSSPPWQRQTEQLLTPRVGSSVYSAPLLMSRATQTAEQARDHLEGKMRKNVPIRCALSWHDAPAQLRKDLHSQKKGIDDWPSKTNGCTHFCVGSRVYSTFARRSLMQPGKFCLSCCPSKVRRKHPCSTDVLRGVLGLTFCDCPLDRPSPLLTETHAARFPIYPPRQDYRQSEGYAQAGEKEREERRQAVNAPSSEKASACCAAGRREKRTDAPRLQQTGAPSNLDNDGSVPPSRAAFAVCGAASKRCGNSGDTAEEQAYPYSYPREVAVPALRASVREAQPIVVIQPPPVSSTSPAAMTEQRAPTPPFSPYCLMPTRELHAASLSARSRQLPEKGDRSRSGDRPSLALTPSSAGRFASPSGSRLAAAYSALGSPVFSNRTTGVGTSAYAPPEQLEGGQYDYSVDIWSLGLIAIDLFTRCGTAMERATNFRNAREGQLPASIRMHFPWIVPFCQWCLQKDPAQRPTIKQLYTHKCITGSVFAPRTTVLLYGSVTHSGAGGGEGQFCSGRRPDEVRVSTQSTTAKCSAAQRCPLALTRNVETKANERHTPGATGQAGSALSFVPCGAHLEVDCLAAWNHAQQKTEDSAAPAAYARQTKQWHGCCDEGRSFYVDHKEESETYFDTDVSAGKPESHCPQTAEGRTLCMPKWLLHEPKSRSRWAQLGAIRGFTDNNRSSEMRMRRGSTSPVPLTSSTESPIELRSARALFSGDEGEVGFAEGWGSLLHAPVPLTALCLPRAAGICNGLPVYCNSPSSSNEKRSRPALTSCMDQKTDNLEEVDPAALLVSTDKTQDQPSASKSSDKAPPDEAPRYLVGDRQSIEETAGKKEILQLSEKHRKHQRRLDEQHERKQSQPPAKRGPSLLPAESRGSDGQPTRQYLSAKGSMSLSKLDSYQIECGCSRKASNTMDEDALTPATTLSTITSERTGKLTPCGDASRSGEKDELTVSRRGERAGDAGGEKQNWGKMARCTQWIADSRSPASLGTKNSCASKSSPSGTGLTPNIEQRSSRCCREELYEHTSDTSRVPYFEHARADQLTDNAVPFGDACADHQASTDATCWEPRGPAGRTSTAEQENRIESRREYSNGLTEKCSVGLCATGEAEHATTEDQVSGNCVVFNNSKLSAEQAFFSTTGPANCGRRKGVGSCAYKDRPQEAVLDWHFSRKASRDDENPKASSARKCAEDSVYSAVKNYAQTVLNKFTELSATKSRNLPGQSLCGSPTSFAPPDYRETTSLAHGSMKSQGQRKQSVETEKRGQIMQGQQQQRRREEQQQQAMNRQAYCQRTWYSFEEKVSNVPALCGSMHLRGFLSLPNPGLGQPSAQPRPLRRRAQVYMRSRRGRWKCKFAAVDEGKKVIHIFSDRNDATKASRLIQIEGEEGYCGVVMWHEGGSLTFGAEQRNAQTCFAHGTSHESDVNSAEKGESCSSGRSIQLREDHFDSCKEAAGSSNAKVCATGPLPETGSPSSTDEAARFDAHTREGLQETRCEGKTFRIRASTVSASVKPASTRAVLTCSSKTKPAAQDVRAKAPHCFPSPTRKLKHNIESYKPPTPIFNDRPARGKYSSRPKLRDNEADASGTQVGSSAADETVDILSQNRRERETVVGEQRTHLFTESKATDFIVQAGNRRKVNYVLRDTINLHHRKEEADVDRGVRQGHGGVNTHDARHLGLPDSRQKIRQLILRAGTLFTKTATEEKCELASRTTELLLDRVKELWGVNNVKVQTDKVGTRGGALSQGSDNVIERADCSVRSRDGGLKKHSNVIERADCRFGSSGCALTKGKDNVVERADCNVDGFQKIKQRNTSQKSRWSNWFPLFERAFAGWLLLDRLSLRKADLDDPTLQALDHAQDPSPAAEERMLDTARLAKTSKFLKDCSGAGARSASELNILLTHSSCVDDVWMRVALGKSRFPRRACHKANKLEFTVAPVDKSRSLATAGGLDADGEQGTNSGSSEDVVEDESLSFLESLIACFQFTEVKRKQISHEHAH